MKTVRELLDGYDAIDALSLAGIAILGTGLALISWSLSLIVVGGLLVSVNASRLWLAAWRRGKE